MNEYALKLGMKESDQLLQVDSLQQHEKEYNKLVQNLQDQKVIKKQKTLDFKKEQEELLYEKKKVEEEINKITNENQYLLRKQEQLYKEIESKR